MTVWIFLFHQKIFIVRPTPFLNLVTAPTLDPLNMAFFADFH